MEFPKLITAVRAAVKADALDKDLMRKYLAIGLQMNEDENNIKSKISKEDEATLRDIYRDGVWKKAKPKQIRRRGKILTYLVIILTQ